MSYTANPSHSSTPNHSAAALANGSKPKTIARSPGSSTQVKYPQTKYGAAALSAAAANFGFDVTQSATPREIALAHQMFESPILGGLSVNGVKVTNWDLLTRVFSLTAGFAALKYAECSLSSGACFKDLLERASIKGRTALHQVSTKVNSTKRRPKGVTSEGFQKTRQNLHETAESLPKKGTYRKRLKPIRDPDKEAHSQAKRFEKRAKDPSSKLHGLHAQAEDLVQQSEQALQ